jgi:hypothetical protein
MDYNYKFIGNISTSNFFSNFTEEDWNFWILKQQKFYVHRNTNTIPIILDETYEGKGSKTKFFKYYKNDVIAITDIIKKVYGTGDIIRMEISRLPKKSKIPVHVDSGLSLENDKRIHIVLQTNEDVIFTVGGEDKNMKLGEMWEINNTKLHSVNNNSIYDRIHIIIDYRLTIQKNKII